jgi:hypothetical protein
MILADGTHLGKASAHLASKRPSSAWIPEEYRVSQEETLLV